MAIHIISRLRGRRCPGPVLRAIGAALIGGAVLAVLHLRGLALQPGHLDTVGAYLLAAFTVLAASSGATMLALGAHCYDRVQVSRRWANWRSLDDEEH